MKKIILIVLISTSTFMSCQKRFDGKNEETTKESRKQILKGLNNAEKKNLNNALDILSSYSHRIDYEVSMCEGKSPQTSFVFNRLTNRLKKEDIDEYKGLSYKEVLMKMLDGLTYLNVLDLAEKTCKDNTKNKIDETSKLIDSLSLRKEEMVKKPQHLNLFKVNSIKIFEFNFLDELIPKFEVDYEYIGKTTTFESMDLSFKSTKKSTNEIVENFSHRFGNEREYDNRRKIKKTLPLYFYKEKTFGENYSIENANLSDYDMELSINVERIAIDGKVINKPEMTIPEIETKIKESKLKLEKLKAKKAPFFKLETIIDENYS